MALGRSRKRHTGAERSCFTLVLKLIEKLKEVGNQSIEETKHDSLAKPLPLFVPELKKSLHTVQKSTARIVSGASRPQRRNVHCVLEYVVP